jgi:hypothetical protein
MSGIRVTLLTIYVILFSTLLVSCGGGGNEPSTENELLITDTVEPSSPQLVNASSADETVADISWKTSSDDQTPANLIIYQIHLSQSENFATSDTTQIAQLQDASSASLTGLTANTHYFVKLVAVDLKGNRSISNELEFTTAELALERTSNTVQTIIDTPASSITETQLVYNSADLQQPIEVDQILVSSEGNGYLRKVTAVTTANAETVVETIPATLAEVFDQVSFSTSTVMTTPESSNAAKAGTNQSAIQKKYTVDTQNKVQVQKIQTWKDTGFTLIENDTPELNTQPLPNQAGKLASRVQIYDENNSVSDGHLEIIGAKSVILNTGDDLVLNIRAIAQSDDNSVAIRSFELISIKHDDYTHDDFFGAATGNIEIETNGIILENKLVLTWSLLNTQASEKPYIATFKAQEDETLGIDNTLEYQVYIYVTNNSTSVAPEENEPFIGTSTDTNLTLTSNMVIGFEPRVSASGKLALTGLKEAEVIVGGDLMLNQNINIKADASARLSGKSPNVIDKKFVKVVMAGSVPIVVSGTFTIHAEFSAEASAALEINHDFEATYKIDVGVTYKDGKWIPLSKAQPTYEYVLTGDADGEITAVIRLVPDLRVEIYEAAYGNLRVEPYLNATAAVEGRFKYTQDYSPTTDFNQDWGADYRFTKLEMRGGVDVNIRMGLDIFAKPGQDLAGYPSNDPNEYKRFPSIGSIKAIFSYYKL